MQSQVQVMRRCGVGLNPLKDVQGRESTALCNGQIILQATDQKLTMKMETRYNNLNIKLDKLQNKEQHKRKTANNQFYPRTANLTNIKLTHEEMVLLHNGQHSIEKPLEKYWTELIRVLIWP
jgi:transposase